MLGLNADWAYDTAAIRLSPGDTLYLYTDGITEAFNSDNEAFSPRRLEAVLRQSAGLALDRLVQAFAGAHGAGHQVHAIGQLFANLLEPLVPQIIEHHQRDGHAGDHAD